MKRLVKRLKKMIYTGLIRIAVRVGALMRKADKERQSPRVAMKRTGVVGN